MIRMLIRRLAPLSAVVLSFVLFAAPSRGDVLFTFGEMTRLQTLPLESAERALSEEEVALYQNFELYAYTVFEALQIANEVAAADQSGAVVLRALRRVFRFRQEGDIARLADRVTTRADRADRGDRRLARPLRRPAGERGAAARPARRLPLSRRGAAAGPTLAAPAAPPHHGRPQLRTEGLEPAAFRAMVTPRPSSARPGPSPLPILRCRPRRCPAALSRQQPGSTDEALQLAHRPQGGLRAG